ncbi:MAG: hypothetical protein LBR56_00190 [Sporomusaceae bacterium]|jgi:hypothetical protein|nr:hypothetical protein [Sporomusaceae bacterium]
MFIGEPYLGAGIGCLIIYIVADILHNDVIPAIRKKYFSDKKKKDEDS